MKPLATQIETVYKNGLPKTWSVLDLANDYVQLTSPNTKEIVGLHRFTNSQTTRYCVVADFDDFGEIYWEQLGSALDEIGQILGDWE